MEGLLKGPGRSVKANVLWLDVHPDARQALVADGDGQVSLRPYIQRCWCHFWSASASGGLINVLGQVTVIC